jgi:hypothetical protein
MTYLQVAAEAGIPGFILYVLFFYCGFANLRSLRKENMDEEMKIFVIASQASLIGFVVGASFAPEAYQYFPYFAVCYTSVMVAIVREQKRAEIPKATGEVILRPRRYADFFLERGGSRAVGVR